MTNTTTDPYADRLRVRYAGHTPGPWKARGYRVEGDGQVVADTKIMRRADMDPGPGVAESEANARLISDAPTLFDRCIALEGALERLERASTVVFDGLNDLSDALHSARIILTGEAQ